MGPRTGTLTDLEAKSYALLSLGLACASASDKAALGPRGASVPSEWPLGHMSGPDGREGAPKWPDRVLVSGAAIVPAELGGSCVLALGLGAKNYNKELGPKLARGWQVPRIIYEGGGLLKVLGANRIQGEFEWKRKRAYLWARLSVWRPLGLVGKLMTRSSSWAHRGYLFRGFLGGCHWGGHGCG
ncbi:unnamed protein product [Calypogeia fissa]